MACEFVCDECGRRGRAALAPAWMRRTVPVVGAVVGRALVETQVAVVPEGWVTAEDADGTVLACSPPCLKLLDAGGGASPGRTVERAARAALYVILGPGCREDTEHFVEVETDGGRGVTIGRTPRPGCPELTRLGPFYEAPGLEGPALLHAAALEAGALGRALGEIAEGKGRFALDRLEHAENTIEDMKDLAGRTLATAGPQAVGLSEAVRVALKALADLHGLVERGDLVRNCAHDDDRSAFVRQGLRIVLVLKRAQDALAQRVLAPWCP